MSRKKSEEPAPEPASAPAPERKSEPEPERKSEPSRDALLERVRRLEQHVFGCSGA